MPNLTLTRNRSAQRALGRASLLLTVAAVALGASWACTGDGDGFARERRGTSADSVNGALGIPTRKLPPYRVTEVANPGTIRGTIDASGVTAPASSTCGPPPSDGSAIVWLEDIRAGLAVPAERQLDRRLELVAGRCKLEPRLQLALVGSTLNVRNDEQVSHQIHLFRDGEEAPVYRIPFIFRGQLVPAQRPLSVAGVLEARSTQDPSLRSVVVVVDHPYATTVGSGGSFVIDSVPPGRYRVMAMSAAGSAEQVVQVPPAGEQAVALRLAPR